MWSGKTPDPDKCWPHRYKPAAAKPGIPDRNSSWSHRRLFSWAPRSEWTSIISLKMSIPLERTQKIIIPAIVFVRAGILKSCRQKSMREKIHFWPLSDADALRSGFFSYIYIIIVGDRKLRLPESYRKISKKVIKTPGYSFAGKRLAESRSLAQKLIMPAGTVNGIW